MPRKSQHFVDLLIMVPWWVSAGLAPIAYLMVPRLLAGDYAPPPLQKAAGQVASTMGLCAFFVLLFISFISAIRSWKIRRQLEAQDSIESIRSLHWKHFENLIGEAFRRQGYQITETLGGGADGGIDLKLGRNGNVTLVQCKRWTGRSVPVQTVREIYGVMAHENAHAAIVVTTTRFTAEAEAFASGKPIELIDGASLLEMLRGVQASGKISAGNPVTAATDKQPAPVATETGSGNPQCPICSAPMVSRIAKRGTYEGQKFWGCSKYPGCKGILRN